MPTNNEKKNTSNHLKQSEPKQHKEIVFMKLIIILAVSIIPLVLIFVLLGNNFWGGQKITRIDNSSTDKAPPKNETNADTYNNFDAGIPSDKVGDLDNVPQEKIDSLFNNLKN